MLRTFLLCLIIVFSSGCLPGTDPLVTADLTYTNAGGFGTQNAGDYRSGSMFVWNTETNAMQFIDTLSLARVSGERLPSTRTSNRIAGVGVTGLPATLDGQEGLVSASVAAQSSFSVTGGFREDYRRVRSELSKYVEQMLAEGDNPDLLFRPRDGEYRVVVIRSVLRAQDSRLSIGGTDASDPSSIATVALNSPVGEVASVNVRAGTNTSCAASDGSAENTRPVCFFNVVVYKPVYIKGNVRMQWENAPFPQALLPEAFRNVR